MDLTPLNKQTDWQSVHICVYCDQTIDLAEIDLKAITTGIVECPVCKRSSPIEIKIVEVDRRREQ